MKTHPAFTLRTLALFLALLTPLGPPVFGQPPGPAPEIQPEALAFFEARLLDGPNCWIQPFPPALKMEVRGFCMMDPATEFTLFWQPPDRLAIQGELSLPRVQAHLNKVYPDLHGMDVIDMMPVLETQLPICVGQLKRQCQSAMNLTGIMDAGGSVGSTLLNRLLTDAAGLPQSGLVDILLNDTPVDPTLIIRGIDGGPYSGQKLGFHFEAGSSCADRIWQETPDGTIDLGISWKQEADLFLPVNLVADLEMPAVPELAHMDISIDFSEAGGHWFGWKWVMDIPGEGEVTTLEILEIDFAPDWSTVNWEDRLEFVDAEALKTQLDAERDQRMLENLKAHREGAGQ